MNLLSAGCSFIYGAELSDSPDPVGLNPPSQKTWISLYANSRNLNYKTIATCGISNQGIVRNVITEVENNKVDLIIVQWTFLDRFEVRWNNGNYQTFAFWNSWDFSSKNEYVLEYRNKNAANCDLATLWFKNIYSESTAYYYYIKSKVELINYLTLKKIPYVFLDSENIKTPQSDDVAIHSLKSLLNSSNDLNFNGMGFYDWTISKKYPVGIKGHPLDQAHFDAFKLLEYDLDKKFSLVI